MTKKYYAFKEETLTTIGYVSTDEGKIAKVVKDGDVYKLEVVEAGTTTCKWNDVTEKPFASIGTGLTVTENVLKADTQLHFEIFTELPTASADYKNVIALVAIAGTTPTVYREYACVKTSDTPETWVWEQFGGIEASVDQTATAITVNGTILQTASDTQIGLLSAADHVKITGAEQTSNKKTAWQTTPTDTAYPSEKLVKDSLDGKIDKNTASTVTFTMGCDENGPYVEY